MFEAFKRWLESRHLRFAFSIAIVLIAFLLRRYAVISLGAELPPFITFYPAVMIVAVLAGLWPGLLATLLTSAISEYWILPPAGSFKLEHPADAIALAIFCAMGIFVSLLAERFRQHQQRIAAFDSEQELRETRKKMAMAMASTQDVVLITDAEGNFVEFNDAFLKYYRFKSREQCVKSLAELNEKIEIFLLNGEPVPITEWPIRLALRGHTVASSERMIRRKDTGEEWIGSYSFSPIRDENGALVGSVMGVHEITEQKRAENALRSSEARYRTAFQTSLDGISITRLSNGEYLDVNQTLLDMLGYERDEVLGKTSLELGVWTNTRDRENMMAILRNRSSYRDFQAQFTRKNGEVFWGVASVATIEVDGERCMLAVVRDISDAKLAEQQIRNLAFFDPLTGLSNRRLLMERLNKDLVAGNRTHRKHALLFIDLDNFKTLNDTLGHLIGDQMLREVGHRLANCICEAATVGRQGGDEFYVMLEELSNDSEEAAAHAQFIAEKILDEVEQPLLLEGRECSISCSIGITMFGGEHWKTDELLQRADLALYQAKAAGRRAVRFFSPELQAAVHSRATMEEDLRKGIKAGQFELYYQPQFDRGRLCGAEALLRWKHPEKGMIPPNKFIPLAEATLLILPLGDWVLETACRQIAAWESSGQAPALTVAVNISALQLRQPDFAENALDIIQRTGANPRLLELELTESTFVDNLDEVIAKMSALKAHGVRFSVDDFGTGYSSLSYLKRLPLDQLKIDQSFVRDILVDSSSRAIAQTIITLSRAMSLSVIAEGVETGMQREMLAALGCEAYQGYLFSKPLPLDQFNQLAASHSASADQICNPA
jgi:diguanylate cyclase (GGDEF)-like protein/PAS domain S-box-containing protein